MLGYTSLFVKKQTRFTVLILKSRIVLKLLELYGGTQTLMGSPRIYLFHISI